MCSPAIMFSIFSEWLSDEGRRPAGARVRRTWTTQERRGRGCVAHAFSHAAVYGSRTHQRMVILKHLASSSISPP